MNSTMYRVNRPCKRGHEPLRYRATRQCVECVRLRGLALRTGRHIDTLNNLATVRLAVHKDDVAALEAYAIALRFDRGML